ncbi:HAD-IC family P-type ATPase, partial [candidate division GN15 bacterium]|nr:HAD-IC family P-type ATPase [candidate division GN15 bacterium]
SEPKLVPVGERIYAGGRQVGSAIEVTVSKEVSQSQLVSLWNDASGTAGRRPAVTRLADNVARYFTAIVIAIAAVTAGYWLMHDVSTTLRAVTAVLIVACPCALALSSPFALGTAARLLGKAGLFLKNPSVVEDLSQVDTIVFDKTGTLAYTKNRQVIFEGSPLSEQEKQWVRSLTGHSTHPVSRSLTEFLSGDSATRDSLPVGQFREEAGLGVAGVVDGHAMALGSRKWIERAGIDAGGPDDGSARGTWLAIDGRVRGVLETRDMFREGIEEEVGQLADGYQLAVLTGDGDRERSSLERVFGPEAHLAFQQLPHDKREEVQRLTKEGSRVLMVGDGLNDAGALASANVGIAVSENLATFTPASDGIMEANRLSGLTRMLGLARGSMRVIWACYVLSFLYNVVGLWFAVSGQLSPVIASVLMPVSSITIVIIATTLTRAVARKRGLVEGGG